MRTSTSGASAVVRSDERPQHFESGPLTRADEAQPFSVPIAAGDEVVLEFVAQTAGTAGAHLDWVDLRIEAGDRAD